jgi:hypothetical protein
MRLRPVFLCLLALALFPIASSAQSGGKLSVYGTIGASNYGYSFNGNSLTISRDQFGFAGGAFYNFPIASRATLGVDARGSFSPGDTGGAKGFVSARAGFVPTSSRLRPYFQLGVGEVHAKVPAFSFTVGAQAINKFAVDLALGLDVRLTTSLDWRAFELEGGAGSSGNGGTGVGSASFSTGIVYRFGG